jgi:L-alanine-DL-glutamate epimerase-like enolase superfamily enzyme
VTVNLNKQREAVRTGLQRLEQETITVASVQLRSIAPIRLDRPFYDATMGPFDKYHPFFVRITTVDGDYGECEYPASGLWALQQLFLPILLTTEPTTYRQLYHRLFWATRNEGFRGSEALALGHLDRAFCDLFARRSQQPLFRYLGGDDPVVKVYASGGSVSLHGQSLLDELLQWEAEGYHCIKMKIGGEGITLQNTLERVAAVRNALGSITGLAVDANQGLELPEAKTLARELESMNITWLEEPLHSADIRAIQSLCQSTDLPISYGESERTEKVFWTLAEVGVQHLQPIAGHLSSVRGWFEVARLAQERGLTFSSGGTSYFNAPMVAAAGKQAMLEYLIPLIGALQPILEEYPAARDGHFHLSETPGLGTSVDWPLLQRTGSIEQDRTWKR